MIDQVTLVRLFSTSIKANCLFFVNLFHSLTHCFSAYDDVERNISMQSMLDISNHKYEYYCSLLHRPFVPFDNCKHSMNNENVEVMGPVLVH